jgi:hypothetical protein
VGGLRTKGAITCLLAATLLALPVTAQTQAGERRYSLRGQVVDALSGRPITDVELSLSTARWETAADPVMPDSQGRFIFRGLAPGQYVLSAARPDFGSIFFGESPDSGTIQTIEIGPSQEEKAIIFRLVPRSTVTGVITDEFGDPMVRANVTLLNPAWNDGGIVLAQRHLAQTDDRGKFRINSVQRGAYILCAAAAPFGSVAAPSSTQIDFAAHRETLYYRRSCYPDSSGLGRSTLHIAPGQSIVVNLTIGSSSAVRVSGRIVNGPPNLSANLRLVREDDPPEAGGQFLPGGADAAKGTFEFRGVFPGRYRLEADVTTQPAEGQRVALVARLPLVVGSADVDDIELTMEKAGQIEVAVTSAEGEKLEFDAVTIGLRSTVPGPFGTWWALAGEDGSRRLATVSPGTYWLMTRNDYATCVQSARLGEQELLHGMVTVTPGMTARLNVTASKHCGIIKGRVISNDRPVPDAKVLLLLSGSAKSPGDLVTSFTEEQGEFSFPALPFGHYRLWAWSVDELGDFVGPPSLADQEEFAKSVAVNGEEPAKVELMLLTPGSRSK